MTHRVKRTWYGEPTFPQSRSGNPIGSDQRVSADEGLQARQAGLSVIDDGSCVLVSLAIERPTSKSESSARCPFVRLPPNRPFDQTD